jgi:hypothetical protein
LFSSFFEILNFSQPIYGVLVGIINPWDGLNLYFFQRKERIQGLSMPKSSNSHSVNEGDFLA